MPFQARCTQCGCIFLQTHEDELRVMLVAHYRDRHDESLSLGETEALIRPKTR